VVRTKHDSGRNGGLLPQEAGTWYRSFHDGDVDVKYSEEAGPGTSGVLSHKATELTRKAKKATWLDDAVD
jgi:hypothetical protein